MYRAAEAAMNAQAYTVEGFLLDGLESGYSFGELAAGLEARTRIPISERTLRRWVRLFEEGRTP